MRVVEVIHETYLLQAANLSSVSTEAPSCCHAHIACHIDSLFFLRCTVSFSVGFKNDFSFPYCQHTSEVPSDICSPHHRAVQQCPSQRGICKGMHENAFLKFSAIMTFGHLLLSLWVNYFSQMTEMK